MNPDENTVRPKAAAAEAGRSKHGLIRPRVQSLIESASAYPITVVIAPAGFGKTTAVDQTLVSVPNVISMHVPYKSTLHHFIREFAERCSSLVPAMATPPELPPSSLDDINQAVEIYVAWTLVHLKNKTCTISVDDVQNAEVADGAVPFIVRIIDGTKAHLKWILVSRLRGTLPLTRWQAYGDADMPITASDLQMSIEEACSYAAFLNSPATEDDIRRWVDQTSGFAVPLTHAIRTSARRKTALGIMDSSRSVTFEFLADQIWCSLSSDDQSLLEVASFLPPFHIHEIEEFGIIDASSRISRLCTDIALIELTTTGLFTMHDLFRDFVQRLLLIAGPSVMKSRRRVAVDILLSSKQYDAALRVLLQDKDTEYLEAIVECHDFRTSDNLLIRNIIDATNATSISDFGLGMLLLQIEFWSWFGHANRLRLLAEEILKRSGTTSDQLSRAVLAIFKAINSLGLQEQQKWLIQMPAIVERLNAPDRTLAQLCLASFLARESETSESSLRILSECIPKVDELQPSSRVDALIATSITYFYLERLQSATDSARLAAFATDELGTLRQRARALNNLGVMLLASCDPELETLFEPLRDAVERSGCWAFSQTSHWIPALYYSLSGDVERAEKNVNLLFDVPIVNESYPARLRFTQRHSINLINLLRENYRDIITQGQRSDVQSEDDMAYSLATDLAAAQVLHGDYVASETSLQRARESRQQLSAWKSPLIADSMFIEIICLCANGQWSYARRLLKQISGIHKSLASAERALERFCDGQPFIGLDRLVEECIEQPYVGLIGVLIKRVYSQFAPKTDEIQLTQAENDVLLLLTLGKSNKEIATTRARSPETIKRQVAAIYRKLGVENRTSAVAVARERGLS
jgi:DNA-binding CsgD family transcriptional regulator